MPTSTTRPSNHRIYRFGEFEFDMDAADLRRAGRQVRLQPQPMKLLALVIRNSAALVTRDEIRAELWPDGTYVDFDQAVNFAVKQVRDALGDSAERPLYLQTVPRRGYRFIAPVEMPDEDDEDDDDEQSRQPGTTTIRLQKALWSNIAELKLAQRRQRRMTIATVVAAVVIVAVLVAMVIVLR